jgi:hypothetical protein
MSPESARLAIETIDDHRHPDFNAALRLYNRVFPEKEKIDRRYFIELLEEKRLGVLRPFNVHFLVARRGSRVVGIATGNYLAVVNMGFVGYLAAAPDAKGTRVGTRLRQRLLDELRRDARASGRDDLTGVLGEVEASNPWLRHLVRTRNVLALDLDYRQPPLRPDSVAVPLVLYLEPLARPLRRLSAGDVRALVYAIYRRVYRIRFPLRVPEFRSILAQLEGRQWVGRRPMPHPGRPRRR